MATRRTFLKAGLSASLIRPVSARAAGAAYYKAIFDERFAEARAFAAGAAERGIATAAIRGDVTRLFFDDLDLRWKRGPVLLAGYTTPESLFCLDLLARDRGMRVTHRMAGPVARQDATAQMPSGPVFWIIEPIVRS